MNFVSLTNSLNDPGLPRPAAPARTILFLLCCSAAAGAAVGTTSFCNAEKTFCFISSLEANPSYNAPATTTSSPLSICFSLYSAASGWAAIGLGASRMQGADIYMGWRNSSSFGYTIANLKGEGDSKPAPNSIQNAQGVPLIQAVSGVQGLSFSFCRPLTVSAGASLSTAASTRIPCIWAYSSTPPSSNIDSATTASFAIHDAYGSFTADFSGGGGNATSTTQSPIIKPTSSFSYKNAIQVHAVLMWIAWMLCPPIGIFAARYLKTSLGHTWFSLHVILLGLGTAGCTVVSTLIIYLYTTPSHFKNSHAKMGLALLVLMVVQVALGFVINYLFQEDRRSIPLIDRIHWWMGRILVIFALVAIQLGLSLYGNRYNLPTYATVLHHLYIGGIVSLFIYGEVFYGQDTHVHQELEYDDHLASGYAEKGRGGFDAKIANTAGDDDDDDAEFQRIMASVERKYAGDSFFPGPARIQDFSASTPQDQVSRNSLFSSYQLGSPRTIQTPKYDDAGPDNDSEFRRIVESVEGKDSAPSNSQSRRQRQSDPQPLASPAAKKSPFKGGRAIGRPIPTARHNDAFNDRDERQEMNHYSSVVAGPRRKKFQLSKLSFLSAYRQSAADADLEYANGGLTQGLESANASSLGFAQDDSEYERDIVSGSPLKVAGKDSKKNYWI